MMTHSHSTSSSFLPSWFLHSHATSHLLSPTQGHHSGNLLHHWFRLYWPFSWLYKHTVISPILKKCPPWTPNPPLVTVSFLCFLLQNHPHLLSPIPFLQVPPKTLQPGFYLHHSMEIAVVKITDHLHIVKSSGHILSLILLGPSAAFTQLNFSLNSFFTGLSGK